MVAYTRITFGDVCGMDGTRIRSACTMGFLFVYQAKKCFQGDSCQIRKSVGCACAGNAGNVFPATDFKGKRELAIPTCIKTRASRNFTCNFTYLVRGPWKLDCGRSCIIYEVLYCHDIKRSCFMWMRFIEIFATVFLKQNESIDINVHTLQL